MAVSWTKHFLTEQWIDYYCLNLIISVESYHDFGLIMG
jgi:hypothetical protein